MPAEMAQFIDTIGRAGIGRRIRAAAGSPPINLNPACNSNSKRVATGNSALRTSAARWVEAESGVEEDSAEVVAVDSSALVCPQNDNRPWPGVIFMTGDDGCFFPTHDVVG